MIPKEFLLRMEAMLGDAFPAFLCAMEEPNVRAFRVNPLKIDAPTFDALQVLNGNPIADCENGYETVIEKVGAHYAHHAGMIYMQDPSAMTTVQALDIAPDWVVLDACAAPGGKSTQLAAKVPSGALVCNEPNAQRCRILQGNIERMGVKNALVTQTDPPMLAKTYPDYFDLVLTDAPCSGEGMFRKYSIAEEEWSQENVRFCAQRQKEILNDTAKCVRSGGYLLYSTCTFSQEENEAVVIDFLQNHPDFSLCEVKACVKNRTADGITPPHCPYDLAKTRRFYPHISKGEGQYIALMQKDGRSPDRSQPKQTRAVLQPKEEEAVLSLLKELLTEPAYQTLCDGIRSQKTVWQKRGDTVYLCPNLPRPQCNIYTYGTAVCDWVGKRLIPHHHFYSAYGKDFANQLNLCDEARIERYLRGEEIPAPEAQNGFCAVLIHACPTGGGKVSGGIMKNHYPKGLRNH